MGACGVGPSSAKNGMMIRLSTKNKIQMIPRLKMHGVSIRTTPSTNSSTLYTYASPLEPVYAIYKKKAPSFYRRWFFTLSTFAAVPGAGPCLSWLDG